MTCIQNVSPPIILLELIKGSLVIFTDWFDLSRFPRYCPFSVKKTLICLMTFNLFLAGSDSAPSLLPRGFSIIVPKVFDTGFQTF